MLWIGSLFVLVLELNICLGDDTSISSGRRNSRGEEEKCDLWLGPSSVNGKRLGVYSGREWVKGEEFLVGNDHMAIPVVDIDENNKDNARYDIDEFAYTTWAASLMGLQRTEGTNDVVVVVPGLGMLLRHHPSYSNLDWDHSTFFQSMEEINYKQQNYSNRGAMTPLNNYGFQITKHIPQGMELFLYLADANEYENGALLDHEDTKVDQIFPSEHYLNIDQATQQIQDFLESHKNDFVTAEETEELYQFLKEHIIPFVTEHDSDDNHNIKDLMPKQVGKLQAVKDTGGSIVTHFPKMIQSNAWLKKNAMCIDTLYVDKSTISSAGKGAFAKRSFDKGDVIAPMPITIIYDKDFLVNEEETSNQLILNYAFGHPQSSLLFVPMGLHTTYINHAPKKSNINAKLVWTSSPYSHHTTLQQYTPSELTDPNKRNMMMGFDIVATKPIEPDEEILIHYGTDWEKAWERHVQLHDGYNNKNNNDWLKTQSSSPVVQMLNKAAHEHLYRKPFPVGREYMPENVQTMCFLVLSDYSTLTEHSKIKEEWQNKGVYEHDPSLKKEDIVRGMNYRPCKIVEREFIDQEAFYVYTVLFDDEEQVFLNLPHEYIKYASQPYTSDVYWDGAFRHAIGIPDSIFPSAWKDLQ